MEEILKQFKNYKITSVIGLCCFITIWFEHANMYITLLCLCIISITGIFEFFMSRKSEKRNVKIDNHSFFIQSDNTSLFVRTIGSENEISGAKLLCIKDYLQLKFTIGTQTIGEEIKKIQPNKICYGNCGNITKIFKKSIDETNKAAREIGIPELFIDKFMKFHQQHIDIYFKIASGTCNCQYYEHCIEKMPAHLSSLEFVFALTVKDMEKTIEEFNGELDLLLSKINYLERRNAFIDTYNLVKI